MPARPHTIDGTNQLMLRRLAVTAVLLPSVLVAQNVIKGQNDRTKVLDVAANTPFFTKAGANAVKKVVAGGESHKADENVLEPVDTKAASQPQSPKGPSVPGAAPGGPDNKPQAAPPAPEAPFAWRLIGISFGRRNGMALFESGGKNLTVQTGAVLDGEAKVIEVTKQRVVVLFHGKRLELIPW